MVGAVMKSRDDIAEYNYHLLRNALSSFSKNLEELSLEEHEQVARQASQSYEMENLVLQTEEARSVMVSPARLDEAVAEIRARYQSDQEFDQDLDGNGLDRKVLRNALYRELVFDSVMQLIGSKAADINELDIHLFYEMHHERFEQQETRKASHILVTVNEDFAENSAQVARQRIDEISDKLGQRSNRFGRFASRHSECPTAMDNGKLGEVKRGQLFPELDQCLFSLAENEISPVIQSEMGFHILWCEKILPARRVPLSLASDKIREILQQRRQRNCQKTWLKDLKQQLADGQG